MKQSTTCGGLFCFNHRWYNNFMDTNNLNQLQSDFISTVSHELRTPLTSIRGFAETLITSKDKLSEEQQLKFLNIIKDQSNRLINLVENLLAATTQNVNKETCVLKSTNISSSLVKIISIIKQSYPRKTIEVKTTSNIENILADEEKFEQVLLNVIENACKYSYENSKININIAPNNETEIIISITNEGETIDSKNFDKIFKKFVRLDNPMTRLTQGSGMGLFLTKEMITQMNGRITVSSENNITTFSIFLPAATEENFVQSKLKVKNDD